MSQSMLNRAWKFSWDHSPILNLFRWLNRCAHRNLKAFECIERAGLPPRSDVLIRQTIKGSKLWSCERIEVARELISHTLDALESGKSDEEIADSFGDPKRVAKLMRRSMKRKRPIYWKAYRNTKLAGTILIGVLVVGYSSLVVRFFVGKPNVKTNYIAMLNEKNEGYREDQKAYPILLAADIAWFEHIEDEKARHIAREKSEFDAWHLIQDESVPEPFQAAIYGIPDVSSENPDYESLAAHVRAFEPELKKIRHASTLPVMGMLYSDEREYVIHDSGYKERRPIPYSLNIEEQDSLAAVKLPHLSFVRKQALILLFDARLALDDGDFDRYRQDLEAVFRLAILLHDEGFLINTMVSIGIMDTAYSELENTITRNSSNIDRQQLVEIAHGLSQVDIDLDKAFQFERDFISDLLQRAFTDDGNGNGRITSFGQELMRDGWVDDIYEDEKDRVIRSSLEGPEALLMIPSRKELFDLFDSRYKLIEQTQSKGPEALGMMRFINDNLELKSVDDELWDQKMFEGRNIGPQLQNEYRNKMHRDATLTMIAIELYQLDHGEYPETLDELVPQYLPKIPMDVFQLDEPIAYVKGESGGYGLYSVGVDGDHDDARIVPLDKPYRSFRHSLWDRYELKTKRVERELVLGRDESGDPIMVNPSEPDGDWVFTDTRE